MRRLLALSVLFAMLLAVRAGPATRIEAALEFPTAECSDTATVTFSWQPGAAASAQWLDISTVDGSFAPGSFLGAGPLPPDATTLTWPGILPGVTHFWRVNALTPTGWVTSEVRAFVPCGTPALLWGPITCEADGMARVDFRWAPASPPGIVQWLDLSLNDNGFAPDTFAGAGPLSPSDDSYSWRGVQSGPRYFFRVNTLMPWGWVSTQTGSFVADCGTALVRGSLAVHFLDVSLGNAVYIKTPNGQDIVIDGGNSADELSAFLDQIGDQDIDLVIASHPDADHIRGLVRVLRERSVGAIWTNGEPRDTQVYAEFAAAVNASIAVKTVSRAGDRLSLGGVGLTVLGPKALGSDSNNNSVAFRLDCGSSSFLFPGDAEFAEEREMIGTGLHMDIDVLELGHHGSRTSTSPAFLTATTPRIAVYQAESPNHYGHPHQETLDRLAQAGVQVYGTGRSHSEVLVTTACDDEFMVTPPNALVSSGSASVTGQPAPTPVPTPLPQVCDPAYPTVCIPPPPPDLNCADIPYRDFPVLPPDPHRFDGDGDGIGCES